jgi:hypothetical protein
MPNDSKPTKQQILDEVHKLALTSTSHMARLEAYRLIAEIENLIPIRHAAPPAPALKT